MRAHFIPASILPLLAGVWALPQNLIAPTRSISEKAVCQNPGIIQLTITGGTHDDDLLAQQVQPGHVFASLMAYVPQDANIKNYIIDSTGRLRAANATNYASVKTDGVSFYMVPEGTDGFEQPICNVTGSACDAVTCALGDYRKNLAYCPAATIDEGTGLAVVGDLPDTGDCYFVTMRAEYLED